MARRVWPFELSLFALFALAGCGIVERAERPAWRTAAENYCLVHANLNRAYIEFLPPISGPGICGMEHPLKVTALTDGAVRLDKPLVIDCSMVSALEDWMASVVQPAAQSRFGAPVSELDVFSAFSCRSVDNIAGAKLSEHSFGNAVDVAGFRIVDGRQIIIVRDWKKVETQEAAFLRDAHAGACDHFTTVLGPGADVFHYNHFHLDLAMHGNSSSGPRRYCRPTPNTDRQETPTAPGGLPPTSDAEAMDVARLSAHRPANIDMSPMVLQGANIALPPPVDGRPIRLEPPVLPDVGDQAIDRSPTSSLAHSDDD